MNKRIVTAIAIACLSLLLVVLISCARKSENARELGAAPPSSSPSITISYDVPNELNQAGGGASKATLHQAAAFAWQEFIGLNWPAQAGVRDTADKSKKFGEQNGPLVWQTYRGKVEIFPGNGTATVGPPGTVIPSPTPGTSPTPSNPPDYGYDQPPQYIYGSSGNPVTVPPCMGQPTPAQPAWVNLDEVSQIALARMYAGVVPSATPSASPLNSQPQLIRFMAKANRTQYQYVVQNQYWYNQSSTDPIKVAAQSFINTTSSQNPPQAPKSPYVSFPPGTIEVKAAFRQLAPNEDSSRFQMTTVRYYEQENGATCYREAPWALIALHIIQKTPSAPSFIYATFEQADNTLLPQNDGSGKPVPVEDADGNIINPPTPSTPTTPALSYQDGPTSTNPNQPMVSASPATAPYCTNPGNQIFYQNIVASYNTGVPTGGNICVNKRDHALPPDIIAANQAAHAAIKQYNSNNGITNSPWAYYKLVDVQAYPFDKGQIDFQNPNGVHNPSTFYQSNIVVETSYTLQFFSGRLANNGPPTDIPPPAPSSTPSPLVAVVPPNDFVYSNPPVSGFNMGGCMGCHANAQSVGYDFSFILRGGPVPEPEHPATSSASLIKKYGFVLDNKPK
jgi:hypothetical protein